MGVEVLGGFRYWRSWGSVEETASGMTAEGATFPGWMTWFACRGWMAVCQGAPDKSGSDDREPVREIRPRLFNRLLCAGWKNRRLPTATMAGDRDTTLTATASSLCASVPNPQGREGIEILKERASYTKGMSLFGCKWSTGRMRIERPSCKVCRQKIDIGHHPAESGSQAGTGSRLDISVEVEGES